MPALFREPLLHFLVLGSLLFGADALWQQQRKPVVEIKAQALTAQAGVAEQRFGRPLTAQELQRLESKMLEDEILFREAQLRGMVADNRVRNTLIQMMRSSLKPVTAPPSEKELEETRARLPLESTSLPAKISFEHVSFTSLDRVPADLLEKLRAGEAPPVGDAVRLGNPLPPTFRPQLERLLGAEFVGKLFKLPINEWHGPLQSTRGVHLLRVVSLQPDQPLPMEEMRHMLESRWREAQEDKAVEMEVEKLKANYRVIRPDSTANKQAEAGS